MDRRNFLKASGWTLLGLAAAETIPGCAKLGDRDSLPGDLKKGFPSLKDLKVFWGDVHNHCNVTYGHGDLSDALAAAEQQLDFVSVTPHALWHSGRERPAPELGHRLPHRGVQAPACRGL